MSTIKGHCNCGKVQVTIPKDKPMGLCHCTHCRRQSGAMASGNFVVEPLELQLSGETKIYTDKGDSGDDVYRHFCDTCGSSIYTGLEAGAPHFIKTGLFNKGDVPAPSMELFCRNLESWEKVHPGAQAKQGMQE